MAHELVIPKNWNKSLWTSFIKKNRRIPYYKKVYVRFSIGGFLEPYHIVSLACLLQEYINRGMKVEFLPVPEGYLNSYLQNIRLLDCWESTSKRNAFTPTSINTNLCLWKIDKAMISEYVVRAQQYFEQNFLEKKDAEPLNIALAESFNNIFDHSFSEVGGYCISQIYPNINRLKFSVCDFGKGIPIVVNEYLSSCNEPTVSQKKAIKLAFKKQFSTKSKPHNRGYGLDTIKNIVIETNGTLRMVTNKVVLTIEEGKTEVVKQETSFNGTHLEIILDTNAFSQKENDYLLDEGLDF